MITQHAPKHLSHPVPPPPRPTLFPYTTLFRSAQPLLGQPGGFRGDPQPQKLLVESTGAQVGTAPPQVADYADEDRKSTRLNSSHVRISYAVFCLKKTNTV